MRTNVDKFGKISTQPIVTPGTKNGTLFFVPNRFRNAIFITEHKNRNVIILVLLGTNQLKNNFVFKPWLIICSLC